MNILVTGAAGFIGSHVAENLQAAGHSVLGVDNFSAYYDRQLKQLNAASAERAGVKIQEMDLAKSASDLAEFAAVVHFAAQPGISSDVDFEAYERNNIQATQNLIKAATEADEAPFFLHISTSSVYGLEATGDESTAPQPATDYGVTKLAAEQLVLSHQRRGELPAASLRLFSVYGPRERPEKLFPKLILAAETGQAFPLYEGSSEHIRSFTYVGDVAEAVSRVIERQDACNGEIINIGTDTTRTTGEAIGAVEAATGTEIAIDIKPARSGDQSKTSANIGKARALLSYEPTTTLEAGVAEHVRWFQENNIAELM